MQTIGQPKQRSMLLFFCCSMRYRNRYISLNLLDIILTFIFCMAALKSHSDESWYFIFQLVLIILNGLTCFIALIALFVFMSKKHYTTGYHKLYYIVRRILHPVIFVVTVLLGVIFFFRVLITDRGAFHTNTVFYIYWFFQVSVAVALSLTSLNTKELLD